MDLNATASTPPPPNVGFPPPPPGLNYIAAIQPSLIFLMIGTVWSGILLPLLIALFYFSTRESRRQPIFVLNVLSVTLGLFMGVFNAVLEINAILSPSTPFSATTSLVFSEATTFTPWLVELILVVRLVAVYPYTRTPKRLWYAIFIPLFLIKIGRLVNNTIFTVDYINIVRSPGSGNPIIDAQRSWNGRPNIKIEWILQVIDNTVTSILFIRRLKTGLTAPGREVQSGNSHTSYVAKLKALFWIAVSNFVFPVILSIIQLVMLFRDPNFLKGSYTFLTNDYVEIVGVLLATVWASTTHWTDQKTEGQGSDALFSAPRFARNHVGSGSRTYGRSDTLKSTVRMNHLESQIELGNVDESNNVDLSHVESQLEFASAAEKHTPLVR